MVKVSAALPALTKSLVQILNTSASDDTKKAAIEAISKATSVGNTTVTGCSFTGK